MSFLNWEGNMESFSRRTDWVIPGIIFVLTVWSILAIFSTNSARVPDFFDQEFPKKQMFYIGAGWVAYWLVALTEPKVYARFAWWIYAFGILLLLPVALCALLNHDLGSFIVSRFGARRWLTLPFFSIQPAEFAKISTLILLAFAAGRGVAMEQLVWPERKCAGFLRFFFRLRLWRELCSPIIPFLPLLVRTGWIAALPFGLIYVQPDLGSALTYIPMAFVLLFIANVPLRFFAFIGVLMLPVVAVLTADMVQYGRALRTFQQEHPGYADPAEGIRQTYRGLLPIRNYHRERIMTLFAQQLIDPRRIGKSWQLRQALMAVAMGGLTGQGFQQGAQARLGWLPVTAAHNDFLFSCIAEESGFIGGFVIIGLFGLLTSLALRIAARARERFGVCLVIGAAVFIAEHVVINIGMNIGIMPVTGVSLPFLSYGGSFILSCFLLFGLVQSVHRDSRPLIVSGTTTDSGIMATGWRLPRAT
ncbi:MAG: FtsW/RodA/SpoVE family cell cycle protein [Puniceicoccales bacterium]|nr:FtsW/RodA/SpoVE family cell cycle protein [Puniceicoccales bacterium]